MSTSLGPTRTKKTVENILQTLFSILATARRFGHTIPPVKRSDIVVNGSKVGREVRFFDASQVSGIIAGAAEPFATMFAVLGLTGLRAGELLGLKVSDLDFNRNLIHVQRSIDSRTRIEQTTKGIGSAMDVPMPPSLERRLQTFLKSHWRKNPRHYVFTNRNLRPYSVRKVTEYGLWPVQDKLGIARSGVHAFRHTAASEMLENGASLPVV